MPHRVLVQMDGYCSFYKVYTLLDKGNVLRDCTDCPIVLWSDESHTFYDIDTC